MTLLSTRRTSRALVGLLGLAMALFVAAWWVRTACDGPALPGDEAWTLGQRLSSAWTLLLGTPPVGECLSPGPLASSLEWACLRAALWLVLAVAAWLAFEFIVRPAQRRARLRGGQVLVALPAGDDEGVLATRRGRAVLVARTPRLAQVLSNRHWREHVVEVDEAGDAVRGGPFDSAQGERASGAWASLGVSRAAEVLLLTDDDLGNVALARAALATLSTSSVALPAPVFVVRLEDRTLRAGHGAELFELARARGVTLRFVSTGLAQVLRGLAAGRPSLAAIAGAARVHVAVGGGGPLADDVAIAVARQGYGLETAVPLLTLVRLGDATVSSAVQTRLRESGAVVLQSLELDVTDEASVGRAVAALCLGEVPASVVHCVGGAAGQGSALARVIARRLQGLGVPPPVLVAYEAEAPLASSGPDVSVVVRDGLADVERRMAEGDRLARAMHEHYVNTNATPGTASAAGWEQLAPFFHDENRFAADHVGWKFDLVGLSLVDGVAPPVGLTDEVVERLAQVEHARWMAARLVRGWKLGPRDDARLLHPSLVPYAALPEAEKKKDRDQVRVLPDVLALTQRSVVADVVCALWGDEAQATAAPVLAAFASAQRPAHRLVVRLACVEGASEALAAELARAGVAFELVESALTRPVAGAVRRVRVLGPSLDALRAEVLRGASHEVRAGQVVAAPR